MIITRTKLVGIYSITCKTNGKIYIGQSKDIKTRFRKHRNLLNKNKHTNSHLQHLWSKYGESTFEFSVLEEYNGPFLTSKEKFYIEKFSKELILNLEDPSNPSKKSPDTLAKISKKLKGRKLTPEWKLAIGKSLCGRKHSLETIQKLKLVKRSDEHKKRIAESNKLRICSDETKKKIGLKSLGRIPWNKGKKKCDL